MGHCNEASGVHMGHMVCLRLAHWVQGVAPTKLDDQLFGSLAACAPSSHPVGATACGHKAATHSVTRYDTPDPCIMHWRPMPEVCPGPHLLQQLQAYGPLASNDRPVVIWWHKHCSSLCCYLGCCCLPGCYGRLTKNQIPWNSVQTAETLHRFSSWTRLLLSARY